MFSFFYIPEKVVFRLVEVKRTGESSSVRALDYRDGVVSFFPSKKCLTQRKNGLRTRIASPHSCVGDGSNYHSELTAIISSL